MQEHHSSIFSQKKFLWQELQNSLDNRNRRFRKQYLGVKSCCITGCELCWCQMIHAPAWLHVISSWWFNREFRGQFQNLDEWCQARRHCWFYQPFHVLQYLISCWNIVTIRAQPWLLGILKHLHHASTSKMPLLILLLILFLLISAC